MSRRFISDHRVRMVPYASYHSRKAQYRSEFKVFTWDQCQKGSVWIMVMQKFSMNHGFRKVQSGSQH
jgi:hypothetical protein